MRKIVLSIIIASLMGCSMGHRDPVEIKQALDRSINDANRSSLDELPDTVQNDLMPDLERQSLPSSGSVKRFRVQAQDVDAKAFFTSLLKGTEFSAAIHPDVDGDITVNLTNVTLDEVLNVVKDMYGYDISRQGKIIQIYPAGLRTETIEVDYLQLSRKGRSLTSITTGSITNNDDNDNGNSNSNSSNSSSNSSNNSSNSNSSTGGTEIETISESDFWPQLQKAVSSLIGTGEGRGVFVTPQASVITVRAYPDEIREVRQFLGMSQKRLQRQVILEAKILEVTLSDGHQQGINWSNLSSSIGSGGINMSTTGVNVTDGVIGALPGMNSISALLGGQTNITVSDGNFGAVLSFISSQGDLNVLSSPRVTAANNQKAVIKVGTDEYFVTNVNSVVGNGDSSSVGQDVELTPFFSGISLDVTPQIDDKGNVLLHVHPSVIDIAEEVKEISLGSNGGTLILPLAKSSIRESDSVIRAKDGDVVVIGGLMKSNVVNQVTKVPFLGDIPVVGNLFRNTAKITEKTELVILLKPTVVGVNTWSKELERSRDLLQEWFPDDAD